MRPLPHSQDHPVLTLQNKWHLSYDETNEEATEKETKYVEFQPICFSSEPHLLSQGDLNDQGWD